jgi:signal transduction histidine kinase
MEHLLQKSDEGKKVCKWSIVKFSGLSEKTLEDSFRQALAGKISRTDDFKAATGNWYYASFIPNLNTDEDVIGIVVIITDISERKMMELDLAKERDKAKQSDHLKSAFLANMSHEIRTPMNSIIGFSEMLEDDDVNELERKQYSGIIRTNSTNLLRIIDDILNIAKIETQQVSYYYSNFALNQFVEDLASNLRMIINRKDKDITVKTVKGLKDTEDIIYSDKERLYQVLTNLMTNAEKFTEKGSVVVSYEV